MTAAGRFFVQEARKEMWHAEDEGDCELMLCGKRISVDAPNSRVGSGWGSRRCPDCWMKLEVLRRIAGLR